MYCSASRDNVKKFIQLVHKELSAIEGVLDIDVLASDMFVKMLKATNSKDKATEYIRLLPSAIGLIAFSEHKSQSVGDLIDNDGISLNAIAKMAKSFIDREKGWNAASDYVNNLIDSKKNAIEVVSSLPTEEPSPTVDTDIQSKPLVRETRILHAARKVTVLSTYDRDAHDYDTNDANPAAEASLRIQDEIIRLLPSAGYDSTKIELQGIKGVIFKAVKSSDVPNEQLRSDQNVDDWNNNLGVVIVLSDMEGNPIKADANGVVSESGKWVYFKIRNTDFINGDKLSEQDLKNIDTLSRVEGVTKEQAFDMYMQDVETLSEVRKDALEGKDVRLVINGGSLGWANNDHNNRTRISEVTNLGNTPIHKSSKGDEAYGIERGEAYIKIGSEYGQNVPIERPRIASETELGSMLSDLLTKELYDNKGKKLSPRERESLVNQFLLVSSKTTSNVNSYNRIYLKDDVLVVGLHSFDLSKPSGRQLAKAEVDKYFSGLRVERRLKESELQPHHKKVKKGETLSMNSVEPSVENGKPVSVRNAKGVQEQLYNVYDYAKLHINFKLIDKQFNMPTITDLGNGKAEVSTSKMSYNQFIKDNFFLNLKLNSKNEAVMTGAYATFRRDDGEASFSGSEVVESQENVAESSAEESLQASIAESKEIEALEESIISGMRSSDAATAIAFNIDMYKVSPTEVKNLVEDVDIDITDGISINDAAKAIKVKNGIADSVEVIEDLIRDYFIQGAAEFSQQNDILNPKTIKRKLSKERKEYEKVNGKPYVSFQQRSIDFSEFIKTTDAQFSNSFQKVRGTMATSKDVAAAKEWWGNHPMSKVISFEEAFNVVNTINENNIASFENNAITLFKGSDSTELYHEAWHAFTSVFLSDIEKNKIYSEVAKFKGSFVDNNGVSVEFAKANQGQIEEWLAESFRNYAISENKKGLRASIVKLFDKILNFLKGAFNGYSSESATSNPYIREMFRNLRVGNVRNENLTINQNSFTEYQKGIISKDINGFLFDYISNNNNNSTFEFSINPLSEDALNYAKSEISSSLGSLRELAESGKDSNAAKEFLFYTKVLNEWGSVVDMVKANNAPLSANVNNLANNLVYIAASKTNIYDVMEGIREAFLNDNVSDIENAINSDKRLVNLKKLIGSSNTNAPLEMNLWNSFINSFRSDNQSNSVVDTSGFISFANGELSLEGEELFREFEIKKGHGDFISPSMYRVLAIGAGVWSAEQETAFKNGDSLNTEVVINGKEYSINDSIRSIIGTSEDVLDLSNVTVGEVGASEVSNVEIISSPSNVPTFIEEYGHYKGYKLSNGAESIGETELFFSEQDTFKEFVNNNFGIAGGVEFSDYNEYKSYKIESQIAEKDFIKDFRYDYLLGVAKENAAEGVNVEDFAKKLWVRDVALERSNNKNYLTNSATALLEPLLNKHPHLRDNTFIKSLSLENGVNIKHSELSIAEFNELANSFRYLTRKESIKASDVSENNLISEYFNSLVNASKLKGGNLSSISDAENISKNNIIDPLISTLKESNLAKDVKVLSNDGIVSALENLGVSKDVAKQVAVWHGSPHRFDKFSTEFMGIGGGEQSFGWGLYFTDMEDIATLYASLLETDYDMAVSVTKRAVAEGVIDTDVANAIATAYYSKSKFLNGTPLNSSVKKEDIINSIKTNGILDDNIKAKAIEFLNRELEINRNLYKVTIHKGKQPSEYNWLEWDKPVSQVTLDKVYRGLVNMSGKEADLGDIEHGQQLYDTIEDILGSSKEASLFLLKNGIDGIKYPEESISNGAAPGVTRGFNYVVFDENAVTIEEVIQFQKELSQKGIQPIVNGFVHNDIVYLNKDTMGLDTPIHEFGHLYLKALKNSNPELYKEGLKKVNSKEAKEYIDYVKATQPELKEGTEAFNEEVLAQVIGENGARLIDTNKKNSLKEWLNDFWEFIKGKLGLSQYSIEEVQNMTLGEYAEAISVDLLSGNNLAKGELFNSPSFQINSSESELQQIKEKAIADGTFMKAPNGKDTNLNERQWLQVRSEAFKDWFGDWLNDPQNASKVVDENGEPLVVYHGSDNNTFMVFERSDVKDGGFFFTNSRRMAGTYGSNRIITSVEDISKDFKDSIEDNIGYLNNILDESEDSYEPVEISYWINGYSGFFETIEEAVENALDAKEENPKRYKDKPITEDNIGYTISVLNTSLNETYSSDHQFKGSIQDSFHNAVLNLPDDIQQIYEDSKKISGIRSFFLNIRNTDVVDANNKNWDKIKYKEEVVKTRDIVKDKFEFGNDGAIILNVFDYAGTVVSPTPEDIYIAFNPSQIKSATDNIGTFSSESNDIRYQKQNNSLSLSSYTSALSEADVAKLGGYDAIVKNYDNVASFMTEEEYIETLNCKL